MVEDKIEKDKIEGATQRLVSKLTNERLKEEILKKTINEYKQTIEVVSKLTKKLNHKVIIPFSRIAFYEGQIKYTNNIYQNIGCNTYCERTAEKACDYLKKKLDFYEKKYKIITDSINRLTKEIELALELDQTSKIEKNEDNFNAFLRPDGFLEIREEYHSSDEDTNNQKEKNLKNDEEINFEKDSINETKSEKNIVDDKDIDNENVMVQYENIKRYNNEEISNEKINSKKEKLGLSKEKMNLNKANKNISNKSLNINERGFLNIEENYNSSSSNNSYVD
ncbi:conserved Plasmodium protein, unknown function [Plasmodium gallinaceum]|uniref:Uncharacterized protein n=1 Tax=Plasmodium gallinaceum TaxID=5849 RepID=A0A1J1H023_PLAGA|nr:conserved Plasmodium protein, unknown function [Plasmodium gallinaceum]CRG96620.1 conserved Plasmodium protein, unknown function [Plasmodium gallinaceum]